MTIHICHGIAIVRVQDSLLQLHLHKGEVDVYYGQVATHEVGLALEVVVRELEGVLEEGVGVRVGEGVRGEGTENLVANGQG